MIKTDYYVYEWFIVETGEVFYVGKGSGNRATSMKDRNDLFKQIRRERECDYRILRHFMDNKEAFEYEKERGLELKAIGQAKACFMLGAEHRYTEDSVYEKMQPTWFKKGFTPWNKGKPMDDAQREKLRKARLGTRQSEETKRKRSAALMNHPVSEDVRKRIAAARRKPIIVHDVENNTDTHYESIQDFADECGVTQSALCRVLKSGQLYRKRYILRHANPEGE